MHRYNEMIVKGGASESLVELCAQAAERMSSQSLSAIWAIVRDMTSTVNLPSGRNAIQQRTDAQVKNSLIQSARQHLETQYLKFIQVIFSHHFDLKTLYPDNFRFNARKSSTSGPFS